MRHRSVAWQIAISAKAALTACASSAALRSSGHHAARLRGYVLRGFDAVRIFADQLLHVGRAGWGSSTPPSPPARRSRARRSRRSRCRGGKGLPCSGQWPSTAAIAVFGISALVLAQRSSARLSGAADTGEHGDPADIRQTLTPDELRGRMSSVNMHLLQGGRSWERWKPAWWRSCSASHRGRVRRPALRGHGAAVALLVPDCALRD